MQKMLTLVILLRLIKNLFVPKIFNISKKIFPFKKIISVEGDKSLSIRWVLFSAIADGVSTSQNLLHQFLTQI